MSGAVAWDRRIPLEKCREILGSEVQLTDEQLEAIRDGLYSLADDLLDLAQEMKRRPPALRERA